MEQGLKYGREAGKETKWKAAMMWLECSVWQLHVVQDDIDIDAIQRQLFLAAVRL